MDQAVANKTLHEVGAMIVADESCAQARWDGVSIVAIVGEGTRQVSGYLYDEAGKSTPIVPRDRKVFGKLAELRDAMRVPGEEPWKTCLIQIKRDDMKVSADFEYDNPMRWKVSPANLSTMVEALRPI